MVRAHTFWSQMTILFHEMCLFHVVTGHCHGPICGSGRIFCFKLHFARFELETIKINNLANLLKMFTDGSGSFYKSKLGNFQRDKLYIYSVQSQNAFTERVLMLLRRNSDQRRSFPVSTSACEEEMHKPPLHSDPTC